MEPTENLVGLIFCSFSNLFVKKVVQDLTSGGLLGVWGKWVKHAKYIQFIQVLLEANGLAAGKDHQFKGRYDAEKNAVIISLEKDKQSALSPQKCTT